MKIKNREQENASATLGFVDLDAARSAVLASLRSTGSRRCYGHAIAESIDWYCSDPQPAYAVANYFSAFVGLAKRGAIS